jgi:hypothetical protein
MVLFLAGLFMMFGADSLLRMLSQKWADRKPHAS